MIKFDVSQPEKDFVEQGVSQKTLKWVKDMAKLEKRRLKRLEKLTSGLTNKTTKLSKKMRSILDRIIDLFDRDPEAALRKLNEEFLDDKKTKKKAD